MCIPVITTVERFSTHLAAVWLSERKKRKNAALLRVWNEIPSMLTSYLIARVNAQVLLVVFRIDEC